jgi:enoyl-CoA hydratase
MLDVTQRGRLAVVTLAHGKANALDIELCRTVATRFAELEDADAIVLTGQGRIFSAGIDLVRAVAGGADYLREFLPVLSQVFEAVFFHPRPVVAALNGHAIAGGCVLACAADRRLMLRDGGRVGVTELLVGVPFPPVAFEIMRSVVAPQHLADILYGGATYLPDAARDRGLVDEVVDGDMMERAVAAAQRLADLSPRAFAITKQQLRQAARERLQRDVATFDAQIDAIWRDPASLQRMRDYVERTLKK